MRLFACIVFGLCSGTESSVAFILTRSLSSQNGAPSSKKLQLTSRKWPTSLQQSHTSHFDTNDSLSNRVSSPERYAHSLNLTIAQVQERIHQRETAVAELSSQLQQTTNPREKQGILCRHRLRYGKHPFVCQRCWCYQPICLCSSRENQWEEDDLFLSSSTTMITPRCHSIILWTHREEWGSVSNTGSILPLILQNTRLLMKGLPEHEDLWYHEMLLRSNKQTNTTTSASAIANSSYPRMIPIVLWPQNNKSSSTNDQSTKSASTSAQRNDSSSAPTYWTIEDILRRQEEQQNLTNPQQFVLIAVEGTWRQARRMVSSDLLRSFPRLSLPTTTTMMVTRKNEQHHNELNQKNEQKDNFNQTKVSHEPPPQGHSPSLLAPLRNKPGSMCTAEAVAYALKALEWIKPDEADAILNLARTKVDRVRRYQGKPPV